MKTALLAASSAAGALGAILLATAVPTAAQAATLVGGCATTDISPEADACYGYFVGNVNGNSGDMQSAQSEALAALGLAGPYTQIEHLDISNGSTIDFDQLLNGVTYISIHWGKGQGPLDAKGGGTGFYRLDLAGDANLDTITSNFGSLSNAVLWGTCTGEVCDHGPTIPEPGTWAMMILGFGGVGAVIRRRRGALGLA